MQRKITLNGRDVQYELLQKKVKNINLRIKPNGKVLLSAPARIPISTLENFLVLKTGFILSALDRFAAAIPKPKEYREGEIFRIFGCDKVLHLQKSARNTVKQDESGIYVSIRDHTDHARVKKALESWERKILLEKVLSLCHALYPVFEEYGVVFPEIRIRKMVSRWGSCQPQKGVLTFSTALVSMPESCIEYVVMHEFIHFLVPNHSASFYDQLSALMPDWKERKKTLEANKRS